MRFYEQETFSKASVAYFGLRKWGYHNLTKYSTEVKLFNYFIVDSLTGLRGVSRLYLRDGDI